MKVIPLHPSAYQGSSAAAGARTVAALDIGSSKISCMIAEVRGLKRRGAPAVPAVRITGIGVKASQGVRGGAVIDVEAAEKAVRLAVDAAEHMAGTRIEEVQVNISGGRPACTLLEGRIAVEGGGPVNQGHVALVTARALRAFGEEKREILHVAPAAFFLDSGPAAPLAAGMYADELGARVNVVSVERGTVRNLELLMERCLLRVSGFVIAPHAAARAVVTEDERSLGVAVVEIGAATTSVAVFTEGQLEHAAVIPVGSDHITRDIAAGLGTPLAEAERLKTLHGSVLPGMHDDLETITLPPLGEEGAGTMQTLPRSRLGAVIRPRVEEILELVREEMEKAPSAAAIRQVVLSGGGSQLVGMVEMSEAILGRAVRAGRPRQMAGLPRVMHTPAFAGVCGLLRSAIRPDGHAFRLPQAEAGEALAVNDSQGYFRKVKQWLEQSF